VALDFAVVEFLAANSTSAFLWSSETVWSTAFRVSEESHTGLASQPLRKIRIGTLQTKIGCLRKYGIESDTSYAVHLIGNRFEEVLFQVACEAARTGGYHTNKA
jgi:hypothetical protein